MNPEVYVSVGKDRRRSYNENYYLKNGEEFELELYNPTQDVYACEIHINGKPISTSRLIIKPAQRIFLERFLDDNKRFKFETYEVENTSEAQAAIALNGQIKVKFYKDQKIVIRTPLPYVTFDNNWWSGGHIRYSYGKSVSRGSSMGSITNTSSQATNYCANLDSPRSIETGMVEQGSNSNQSLVEDNSFRFESYTSYEKIFYIYPESKKPIEVTDIVSYCAQCGKRRKRSDNFCSSCGKQY